MVLGVHSFCSLWCWWVSSPHTSELSLQLLLRDFQALEVLDVNFCSGSGGFKGRALCLLLKEDCWRFSVLNCPFCSQWLQIRPPWIKLSVKCFVHFFRSAFPLAAWGKVLACWWRWSVSEQPFSRVLFFFKMLLAVQTLRLTSLFSWGKILEY